MKKAHNKVLTVILTAMLLIGALPFTVGAQERYQEFYIPNISTEITNVGNIHTTPLIITHTQSAARSDFDKIEIIMNGCTDTGNPELDFYGYFTLTDVVIFGTRAQVNTYKNDQLIETRFADVQFAKGVYTLLEEKFVEYGYIIEFDDGNSLIILPNELIRLLPIEMQLFNCLSIDYNGTNAKMLLEDWEYYVKSNAHILFEERMLYTFVPYKPLFDQYTFQDYLHYENEIISSAQTGIAEWTANPTVFLVICIIMGVVLTYILLTSVKEWVVGRRY